MSVYMYVYIHVCIFVESGFKTTFSKTISLLYLQLVDYNKISFTIDIDFSVWDCCNSFIG